MNCPFCGKEMEDGRLYGRSCLFWSPKPDKLLKMPDRESVVLSSVAEYPAAHICKDCRRVVVEY